MDMLTCQYITLPAEESSLPNFFKFTPYVTGSLKVKFLVSELCTRYCYYHNMPAVEKPSFCWLHG